MRGQGSRALNSIGEVPATIDPCKRPQALREERENLAYRKAAKHHEADRTNDHASQLRDCRRPMGYHPLDRKCSSEGSHCFSATNTVSYPLLQPPARRRSRAITRPWSPIPRIVPTVTEPNQNQHPVWKQMSPYASKRYIQRRPRRARQPLRATTRS